MLVLEELTTRDKTSVEFPSFSLILDWMLKLQQYLPTNIIQRFLHQSSPHRLYTQPSLCLSRVLSEIFFVWGQNCRIGSGLTLCERFSLARSAIGPITLLRLWTLWLRVM